MPAEVYLNVAGGYRLTDPGADLAVEALAVQADGKILVGGYFNTLGGAQRKHLGRLTNTNAALQELTVETTFFWIRTPHTTITWRRSGASPEVDRVTFELSTNGVNYTALANPARIIGGWQLTNQSLPTQQNIFIRARGFYSTGQDNGSGSIVETVRNAFISRPVPIKIILTKPEIIRPFRIVMASFLIALGLLFLIKPGILGRAIWKSRSISQQMLWNMRGLGVALIIAGLVLLFRGQVGV